MAPAAKKGAAKDGGNKDKGGDNKKDKGGNEKVMMTLKEAMDAIKEYMIKQNRPYSLQNVLDNMHGRVAKTIAVKVLDELTDKKVLVCKEYGKAKLYLANQDNFPTTSNEEITKLDEKIKGHKQTLADYQLQLKEALAGKIN